MQLSSDILKSCWFVAGPTACGKSDSGVELAERIAGEIVSMDSMTLYRGLDIGTAKPGADLRQRIPHHLIDVLETNEESSVAAYLAMAERSVRQILARGRVPLFVGGSGLYLRSMLRGVFEGPRADPELRRRLEAEAANVPCKEFHARLMAVDPASARRIHPRDTRRVIRALEIYERTGRPLSEFQRQNALPIDQRPQNVYWLSPPRGWLYERVNRRVDRMFAEGLLDEVRRLLDGPRPLSRTARQALGYGEAIDHLEGRASLEETVAKIKARTRRFAKRQHTWFRHLEECRPVKMSGDETPAQLASRILEVSSSLQCVGAEKSTS